MMKANKTLLSEISSASQLKTIDQIADVLNIKPDHVLDLVNRDEIPHRVINNQLLFDAVEVAQWRKELVS